MKVHHLNCGSLCTLSHPIINRFLPGLDQWNLVCHCLLIETNAGLVLVDTGLGLQDVRNIGRHPSQYIFNQLAKPKLDLNETAYLQVINLGFNPLDVKHIIITHFDIDHVGGLADFPNATIHLHQAEWDAVTHPKSAREKMRYRFMNSRKINAIKTYQHSQGDLWQDFYRLQNLAGLDKSLYLVFLPGHTRGHSGVYIEKENGKDIFFTGDAFLKAEQVSNSGRSLWTLPIEVYNRLSHENLTQAKQTLGKLRQLQRKNQKLHMYCSHDQDLFLQAKGSS